ncbi:hypothetical protein CVT25_001900 [Psilocybe cyanescens]|uniref:Uncharacterized protein n=1 Tax=Psilocybe cyanescens TaxID=93625 RepID=A0A409WQY5_PSICY|nr:hypothetical protein CVT25_001900 [Psilocybe cyanescens]
MPITCSQDATGTAIRIAALSSPVSEELLAPIPQYHIFEHQLGSSPTATKIYKANVPQRSGALMLRFLSGDIFVEIHGPCIYMWDIARNVWFSWKHGLKAVQAAFINHGKVILTDMEWVRCWKIPGYRAWVLFDKLMPGDFAPHFISPINQPSSPIYHLARNHLSVCRASSSWYNGLSVVPLLFDIIEAGSSSEYFTVSYSIHGGAGSYGDTDERIDATATALIQDLNYGDLPIAWDSWRMLNGQTFKCFSNFDTIQLAVSGDKVTKAAEKVYSYYDPVVNLVNTGNNLLQHGEFSFDPMSGRLCHASLSDEGSIVVLDFLRGC